ncbi:hypothetical protein KKA02_00470, partial [Patescibacteria group bacterium]|nr:hypothetical protein [Patescibacteria group bacterium]
EEIKYDKEMLLQRGATKELVTEMMDKTTELLKETKNWDDVVNIQNKLLELIKKNNWNTGQYFMVFRVALSGQKITPPIVECLPVLGRDKTIKRLEGAVNTS